MAPKAPPRFKGQPVGFWHRNSSYEPFDVTPEAITARLEVIPLHWVEGVEQPTYSGIAQRGFRERYPFGKLSCVRPIDNSLGQLVSGAEIMHDKALRVQGLCAMNGHGMIYRVEWPLAYRQTDDPYLPLDEPIYFRAGFNPAKQGRRIPQSKNSVYVPIEYSGIRAVENNDFIEADPLVVASKALHMVHQNGFAGNESLKTYWEESVRQVEDYFREVSWGNQYRHDVHQTFGKALGLPSVTGHELVGRGLASVFKHRGSMFPGPRQDRM